MSFLRNLVLVLALSANVFAASSKSNKIKSLGYAVANLADTTSASSEELDEAEALLKQVISLLNQEDDETSNSPYEACYDFSYAKYYQSLSSASATEKATQACKTVGDIEVLKFLYEKNYQSLSAVSAMDKSVQEADHKTKGKLEMIKFMYESYYQSLSATSAATKASQGAKQLKRNSLGCLKKAYDGFYQSLSAVSAMDKAIEACSK